MKHSHPLLTNFSVCPKSGAFIAKHPSTAPDKAKIEVLENTVAVLVQKVDDLESALKSVMDKLKRKGENA